MQVKVQLIDDFVSYAPILLKAEGTGFLSKERADEIYDKVVELLKKEIGVKIKVDRYPEE